MIGWALLIMSGQAVEAPPVMNKSAAEKHRPAIEAVLIHPPVAAMFTCSDHSAQESLGLGDALGTDCNVEDSVALPGKPRGYLRAYRTDGIRNEDWFGWGVEILAPFDGKVVKVSPTFTVGAMMWAYRTRMPSERSKTIELAGATSSLTAGMGGKRTFGQTASKHLLLREDVSSKLGFAAEVAG